MRIGPHDLDQHVLIVAEIGVNHEGEFERACWLVEQAAKAGADAVKFQTYRAEDYIAQNDVERFARVKRFQLSLPQFAELAGLAARCGVTFFSTPLDAWSADALEGLMPVYKIASGDLTHVSLIRAIARKPTPLLLSTGMGTEAEIARTLDVIRQADPATPLEEKVALLHCVSSYPAPVGELHLRAIPYLHQRFGLTVGYSDHALGILAPQVAVALGARIIEKHFTDRRTGRSFRDHQLSVEPAELAELVSHIRTIERMLGEPAKRVGPAEQANLVAMRRSIAARQPIARGAVITWDALTFVRPATGIPAEAVDEVVGRRARRDIPQGAILCAEDIASEEPVTYDA